jgi:hypothetical protein
MFGTAFAQQGNLAPRVKPLTHAEIEQWMGKVVPSVEISKSIIRRGLISSQLSLRADCARYLAFRGGMTDLPYLIDALSDKSEHLGALYPYAGMSTTRYWANVALISISKVDFGFNWDDTEAKRKEAIKLWQNYWESNKHKHKK